MALNTWTATCAVFFTWYTFVVFISLLGVWGIYQRTKRVESLGKASEIEGDPIPVTILRPLKGIDPLLYDCLRSSFVQSYPFELIFCLASADDPAYQVVQQLLAEFPNTDAKVLVGDESYGPNPKVNNLTKGFKAAKHDLLWVLDSNVWVSPNTLGRAVRHFADPKVGLVHHVPIAVALGHGSGSRLEEMYLLTSHSKFYTGINELGIAPCVTGKSNLYRRSDLDRATSSLFGEGMQKFALYISEDHLIAEALWSTGLRTRLANEQAIQPIADATAQAYIDRRVRWIRVRKHMVVAATLVEPTTEVLLSGLIGAWTAGNLWFGGFSWLWLVIHVILWCSIDYLNFHNFTCFANISGQNRPFFTRQYFSPDHSMCGKPRKLTDWLPTWVGRELLALPIWIKSMCGSRIEWRNRPFKIRRDLVAEEITN
ncbi:Ceramide glucosyltransferase [Wickerhamiella sorbophila]|uniref:Ceramide glucosyltransferase n=1 Tax=Wickerhamiella sorbophila TaxID=45607 RepID=A0A2T0FIG4_9ASCO|nr:Ceramide glucosyltransferase [Wickerhamiella sorbophila]PRT54792.1 Ceramide glucosyltransferase [Wickerhamiella sorbophila]